MLCVSDVKNSTSTLLEVINNFSYISVYIINLYKSVALLYTTNKQAEKYIMDIYPLKINSKNTECLGVNLQKEVKVLCNENLKSLKKEMKEDNGNGEACHADEDKINIVKYPFYQRQFTDSM